MRAMILAAGRGERMRPLTDHTPKPLLAVGGKPLIVWHIEKLVAAGLRDIIVNHAWLGEKIEAALGDGAAFGARISYSAESPGGLETAGGIAKALPFFQDEPFLVINGDIWTDWQPSQALSAAQRMRDDSNIDMWLWMTNNPPHHPEGDFALDDAGILHPRGQAQGQALTFTGIGIYRPGLFRALPPDTSVPLRPLMLHAMQTRSARGALHDGAWTDVGTPQRLETLDRQLAADSRA
ncbi:N-acetylmuramate alpha-1-phosphate uridylyltransferase MurU [Paracandidimonas soli]|uniref:MurNAc alpha-1-phosphate uridylyltransferase n=1 Tax=Paracandidimonas soli TaxID=1917182 RepID=A0A4R3VCT1_9BURK|nr:nucleotidyltransferase family protein [Paracandidimonas soli]TCV03137.1 MurNAc alpha-1-phosphate uridylyltransferase [Paracandidimonas soli]